MLKVNAKDDKNAVCIRDEYELWLEADEGSDLYQLNKLELGLEIKRKRKIKLGLEPEDYPELCSYPHKKKDKHGRIRFYRLVPVDSGIADYISKDLNKPSDKLEGAARIAMDSKTKSRAAELYKERFRSTQQFHKEGLPAAIEAHRQAQANRDTEAEQPVPATVTKSPQNCLKPDAKAELESGMERAFEEHKKRLSEDKGLAREITEMLRST